MRYYICDRIIQPIPSHLTLNSDPRASRDTGSKLTTINAGLGNLLKRRDRDTNVRNKLFAVDVIPLSPVDPTNRVRFPDSRFHASSGAGVREIVREISSSAFSIEGLVVYSLIALEHRARITRILRHPTLLFGRYSSEREGCGCGCAHKQWGAPGRCARGREIEYLLALSLGGRREAIQEGGRKRKGGKEAGRIRG